MATRTISNYPIQDISNFAATINHYGGLAKTSRYAVRINAIPALNTLFTDSLGVLRDLTFLCENAEFPGRTLVTSDVRYYGPVQKFPFQTAYNDINLTFICRDEFFEKEVMDSWMNYINPINTYDFRYTDSYATSIDIFQFSEVGVEITGNAPNAESAAEGNSTSSGKVLQPIYQVTCQKAYPTNIGAMTLNWGDDQYHRLQVGFTYTRHFRDGDLARIFSGEVTGNASAGAGVGVTAESQAAQSNPFGTLPGGLSPNL